MGASQSQPTYLPSPKPYPLKTPINPSLEEMPRTKIRNPLKIQTTGDYLEFTRVNGKYLDSISTNPTLYVKNALETEVVTGVQLLKFSTPVDYREFGKFDEEVRSGLHDNYKEVLLTFLKVMKGESTNIKLCGEELIFFSGLYLIRRKSTDKIIGLTRDFPSFESDPDLVEQRLNINIFNRSDFDKYYDETLKYKSMDKDILDKIKEYVYLAVDKNPSTDESKTRVFDKIKQELSACKNRYYIIPIGFYFLGLDYGHENLLILDKFNEQAIVIEPMFYGTKYNKNEEKTIRQTERVNRRYGDIMKKLNLSYTVVIPISVYPQAIADDYNCMFWTFLITVTYFLNSEQIPLDVISSAIIRKYPSKEALIEYIQGFKIKLKDFITSYTEFKRNKQTAGKRHRRKTKRTAQKRIMHANRKLQSTK